jgi:hypothetical protein
MKISLKAEYASLKFFSIYGLKSSFVYIQAKLFSINLPSLSVSDAS